MRVLRRRRSDRRPPASGLVRRLGLAERGQEVVEMVLVAPILVIVLFAVFELGHAFDVAHTLAGLAREGANIASRGTALDTVLDVTMQNGSSVGLTGSGGAVVTELTIQGGVPRIVSQVASSGYSGRSRLGQTGSPATSLEGLGLVDGRTVYAVEVFFSYRPLTPIGQLVPGMIPGTVYDRAFF
jgi:hypothetical protein